ncbi:LacI family DNA-binding transcriptional regulator [Xinfangfangia sp. D13-10-4-6]|uniref:LacI family DNA-binding transcriptional regulator n=1 Tax=Pseudogemmobacter hezensis TaxID=2737662 RepID=UPI0015567190|nr:LacI family DNA-binding transcriptional regulator [Pseudogemmobacter hezensis]NPD14612.1 LacI family DNA-binding transcriptional regulator [Pseudogemmobacter hezensis]
MRKPTLQDVARAAGVSYATADRVLNARGNVAEKSTRRVLQAIETLGYERDLHAANLSRGRIYHFRFLLPGGDHSFFRALRQAVEAEASLRRIDRIRFSLTEVPTLDSDALARALEELPRDCDAVAVVATETPRISAAIAALSAAHIPVVTLVGDAAADIRAAYVGIDNIIAGRTAGRLMRIAHMARPATDPGLILPIIGAMSARDHRDRLMGAKAVLDGSGQQLLEAVVVDDRHDLMRQRVTAALAKTPAISGIYSIGAGNRGLIDILARISGPRPFVIMHDLTPTTRAGLESGLVDAVIDQKPAQEIALAVDVMKALADGRELPDPARDITPTIYVKDNLPAALPLTAPAPLAAGETP